MTARPSSPIAAADARIEALAERVWEQRLTEYGGAEESWLDEQMADRLPDVGPEAYRSRAESAAAVLREVEQLRQQEHSLTGGETLDVLQHQSRIAITAHELREFEAPATSDSSPWGELLDRARVPLRSLEDADRFLEQLAQVPHHLDQVVANMRAGLRRGFGPARISMVGRDAVVRTVAEDAPGNPFRTVLENLPSWLPENEVRRRRRVLDELVDRAVVSAFRTLHSFLTQEYLPGLPEQISAVERYGEEFYRHQIYRHCAMEISAEDIHERGLAAVDGILGEMHAVAARVGFPDDLPGLFGFMRRDPQFYARTPQELLSEAAWESKMFDGVVHQYFGTVPRSRFTIVEPPADLAPFYTFGRGGIGQYTLNAYPLDQRPLYSLPALTLHEAAPGHTFQVALALENTELPEIRRKSYISSYGEGWALYCERLGVEMGMYRTDFETLGMLSFQMWRAARMVLDPGIHALGWSRQKAIDYLRDHTAIGVHEVTTEVDRYIAWPGQAPSYALGLAVIEGLRERAETALGGAFDLPAFHDRILSSGCVPMSTLEASISAWIDDTRDLAPTTDPDRQEPAR